MRILLERLTSFVEAVARAEGASEPHVTIFATRTLAADLRGMDGHGLARLAPYVRRMRAGGYYLTSDVRVVRETPSSALVDGDNGLG